MSAAEVLRDVLVVLVAAKLAAELAERIRIPAVVGEIVAGVIIGPSLLGLVGTNHVLEVLAELGVILLLLQVGMEMDLDELAAVGRASVSVAVIGVLAPLTTGYVAGLALGQDSNTALFLGAALAATSVGITARVFSDLGALSTVEARTVLGAAVADDVLGLVLLTIVVRVVTDGSVSAGTVIGTILLAVGFLVVTTLLGGRLGAWLFRLIQRHSRSAGTLVALALAFALAFAELADMAKLAPIVGAFVAGLALSRTESRERIERELTPVGHLFVPVFFLQIGIAAEVERFVDPTVLGIAGVLIVVAVIGKMVSSIGLFGAPGDRLVVGLGMLPRGEVGLIFATIGLTNGVLDDDLYASLLLVVLVTTLMAPPLLKGRLRTLRGAEAEVPADVMPGTGWLWVDDGVVDLAAQPPGSDLVAVALDASLAVANGARPGPRLLQWLGTSTPPGWTERDTRGLLDVLRRGDERAWRFLDSSGVLLRALPEVAAAVERRRRDPSLVDPTHVIRFESVEALSDLLERDPVAVAVAERIEDLGRVILAAFVVDVAGERPAPELVAAFTERLQLPQTARDEIAVLVAEQGLLRGMSSRRGGADESAALEVVTHLETAELTRALYLLDLVLGPLDRVDRDRLDTLVGRVVQAQEREAVLDRPPVLARRRAEAIRLAGGDAEVVDRLEHTPRLHLLAELPERLVAQARLLEPRPDRHEIRVVVTPGTSGGLVVDVAARDQVGLLAAVADAFAAEELDIVRARVATWGDGAALESFEVEPRPGTGQVESERLVAEIRERIGGRLVVEPVADAEVAFDDAGSPWYTTCEVRHLDRPGLLATIAGALAAAGTEVLGAELSSVDGLAVDRFLITDRSGNKLSREEKDAIRAALKGGAKTRVRGSRLVRRR